MRKIVLIEEISVLAACSQKTEEKTEVAADPAAEATAAPAAPAADSGTAPGTYNVKLPDGAMASTVINADGTYVDTGPDGKAVKGKFANKDGKDCFDPDGDDPEVCWTATAPGADGSFTATDPKGTTVTVTPTKK